MPAVGAAVAVPAGVAAGPARVVGEGYRTPRAGGQPQIQVAGGQPRFGLDGGAGRPAGRRVSKGAAGVIARVWHGWTAPGDAEAYERLLRSEILPGIADRGIEGYRGAHLLRRPAEEEVEFVTILWFESMEGVRAFAGPEHEGAVVPPAARELLSRFDATSRHFEAVLTPG